MKQTKKKSIVSYPVDLATSAYTGKIMGYAHPRTQYYNIVSADEPMSSSTAGNLKEIGLVINQDINGNYFDSSADIKGLEFPDKKTNIIEKPLIGEGQILGIRRSNEILFETHDGVLCTNEPYSLIADVFSRNTGILETSVMLNKTAVISGCGSVGSLAALELARAGVGRFLLIDNDVLSYHNICRHQCGIADVGKYKVDAVAERILQINPNAQIHKEVEIIENVEEKIFKLLCDENAILLGCADNRDGDVYANKISKLFKCSFMSIGLWERAFAGEIFYTLYNANPCFSCLFNSIERVSARVSSNNRFYTTEEDLQRLNFEPGISVDIAFVTIIAIKIAIDILNLNNPKYHPRLLPHISQFTLICNTNNPEVAGEAAQIFSFPLQVTRSVDIAYSGDCASRSSCKFFSNAVPNKERVSRPVTDEPNNLAQHWRLIDDK